MKYRKFCNFFSLNFQAKVILELEPEIKVEKKDETMLQTRFIAGIARGSTLSRLNQAPNELSTSHKLSPTSHELSP